MKEHYNTTNEDDKELSKRIEINKGQNKEILEVYKSNPYKHLSPSQIFKLFGEKWPITSVRRSITNLTKQGYLSKTKVKIEGMFGRKEYTWRLADSKQTPYEHTKERFLELLDSFDFYYHYILDTHKFKHQAIIRKRIITYIGYYPEFLDLYNDEAPETSKIKEVGFKVEIDKLDVITHEEHAKARMEATEKFRKLINRMKGDRTDSEVIDKAFKWLAIQMDIPLEYCYIDLMSWKQCRKVIDLCTHFLNK